MGKRGPPPKPSAQKKLEGTYRKDRAARNEFAPKRATPTRPSYLDKLGRELWDFVVPILMERGVLTIVDGEGLARYCAAHSLEVKATQKYQREGLMLKTPYGPQTHPMIKVAKEARAEADRLGAKFGLTPSDRTKISEPPPKDKPEDPVAKAAGFLFGGGGAPPLTAIPGGKAHG